MKQALHALIFAVTLPFTSNADAENLEYLNNRLNPQFKTKNGKIDKSPPALYRPIFETTEGEVEAGKAFVVEYKKQHYVISAQHLLGTMGGMDRDYSGQETIAIFKQVTLNPIYDNGKSLTTSVLLPVPEASSFSGDDFSKDLFIAKLNKAPKGKVFGLADSEPKSGDLVMLYSTVGGSDKVLHSATLLEYTVEQIKYEFNVSINMRATSGAPILNDKFQVIGINLAAGLENGFLSAYANPYINIVEQLEKHVEQ